jgi:fucose permease
MKYTYKHTLRACYTGYITQAAINNLAPLLFTVFQGEFGLSFEQVGRLILFNFGTQIAADFFAMKYVDIIGFRRSAVLAHFLCAAGLVSLSILPNILPSPYIGLMLSVMIYAMGGGILEVLVSPIVDSLPGEEKESAMSLLHSFYCWGQVVVVIVTTVMIRLLGRQLWEVVPVFWAVVPLCNLLLFLKVPLMPPVPPETRVPLKNLFKSRFFVVALIIMMCAGASELTMSQWSSLFAERGLHVTKMLGDLLGPCLFAVFMGIGRTIYGIWGNKINLSNALLGCGALCVACYLTTVFAPWPLLSLLSCAVCGFSVSLMWPGAFSLTAQKYPLGGTAMFGMLAVFGDLGASAGPWSAGLISDLSQTSNAIIALGQRNNLDMAQLGLKCGLLVAVVFPLILFVCVLLFKRGRVSARS